jgi:hypothetical protein
LSNFSTSTPNMNAPPAVPGGLLRANRLIFLLVDEGGGRYQGATPIPAL